MFFILPKTLSNTILYSELHGKQHKGPIVICISCITSNIQNILKNLNQNAISQFVLFFKDYTAYEIDFSFLLRVPTFV